MNDLNRKKIIQLIYSYSNKIIHGRGSEVRDFFNEEVALFFEPFSWVKEIGQPWRWGTVHSLTNHLKTQQHSMIHRAFPYGVIFEIDKGVAGVTMPKSLATPTFRNAKTLTTKKYGFGMGSYWNARKN